MTQEEKIEQLLKACAKEFSCTVEMMKQKNRKEIVVKARAAAIHFMYYGMKLRLVDIKKVFGQNHATIIHNRNSSDILAEKYVSFAESLRAIKEEVGIEVNTKRWAVPKRNIEESIYRSELIPVEGYSIIQILRRMKVGDSAYINIGNANVTYNNISYLRDKLKQATSLKEFQDKMYVWEKAKNPDTRKDSLGIWRVA